MMLPLPDKIDRASSWTGEQLALAAARWRRALTPAECDEIEAAARAFLATGRPMTTLRREDFPLPALTAGLRDLRRELIDGLGFRVLTGLPVARLEPAVAAAAFCGIGAHLGTARPQNADGHVLGHVRDLGRDPEDPTTRIYQTTARQTFHTDSADAVGLLCLQPARSGGESLLVSAETIFNRLRDEAPELAAALFDVVATDRRGEVPAGAAPWFEIPVLSWHADRLTVQYQRQYIESAQRFDGAPRLSATQHAALDAFDRIANDPNVHLAMTLAPGDMQFVYNHALLHDRAAFIDHDDTRRKRHLLRLWLALPGDRALPACYASRYGGLAPGNRGGVQTGTPIQAPVAVASR
ncbi:MAG: TauD/TfdA family dioxygenase [Pseudomonadota bacterium]